MYIPYKNKHDNPSNPTPVETIDCHDIQADVLATDLSENTKITGLKQLKTDTKIPTKAINALNEQLGNAQASASDALQRVKAIETRVARVENTGAALGNGNGAVDSDLARQMMKEVKNYDAFVQGANVVEAPLNIELPSNADVESRLPTMVKNVKFYNAAKEDYVNIYWNAERYNGMVGEHVLTARYEHGYTGIAPTATVTVLDQESQYPMAKHVFGMVLAEEGGNCDSKYNVGSGTWVRVNQNMEQVDFDPSHGTWAYMRPITHPIYGEFVEIPITYVKNETITEGQYAGCNCWWIADGYADGFHVHPAFIGQDGKPHPLQIAAYCTKTKDDGTPFSEDKGHTYCAYSCGWSSYDELYTSPWLQNDVRYYNIYDHHFLARMMLTEFGTPNVWGQKVDNVKWLCYNRINYHGIYDPFGVPDVWEAQDKRWSGGTAMYIFGFTSHNGTIQLPAVDGSLQPIETEVPCPNVNVTKPNCYIKNCMMTVCPGKVDFGDVFIATGGYTKDLCSFHASTQLSVGYDDKYIHYLSYQSFDTTEHINPPSSSMSTSGPFQTSSLATDSQSPYYCWRMSRCGN